MGIDASEIYLLAALGAALPYVLLAAFEWSQRHDVLRSMRCFFLARQCCHRQR